MEDRPAPNSAQKRIIHEATKKLNEQCMCGLKPSHPNGAHDWCCQVCGGSHAEYICPNRM